MSASVIVEITKPREELKTEPDTNGPENSDSNNNTADGKHAETDVVSSSADGPPDDIRAFYGHPLTAATSAVNDDNHASAAALLHEYINLPALDKSGMKIGEKINSIYDIMKDGDISSKVVGELEAETEYIELLQTSLASDVDKFFNRDGGETAMADMTDDGCPVSVAEEVCIETACLNEEKDGNCENNLYVGFTSENAIPNTGELMPMNGSETRPDEYSVDALNEMPSSTNTVCARATNRTGNPPVLEKVAPITGGRRHRGEKIHGVEKSQELPKKLVKALTEKILKRRSLQCLQDERKELQDAVENVSKITNIAGKLCSDNLPPCGQASLQQSMRGELQFPETQSVVSQSMALEQPNLHYQNKQRNQNVSLCTDSTSEPTVLDSIHSVTQTEDLHVSQTAPVNCVPSLPIDHITKHPQFIRTNSVPVSANQIVYPPSVSMNAESSTQDMFYYNQGHDNHQQYVFPSPRGQLGQPEGRDLMLERYLQQQNQFYQTQQHVGYQFPPPPSHVTKDTRNMKSPDSGYSDACVSPKDQVNAYKECTETYSTDTCETPAGGKVSKRRRSAPAMYVRQYWQGIEKHSRSTIAKLENDPTGYRYFLESPISTNQRIEEDRITYLNKGQYYGLTLENVGDRPKNHMVKSIIMAVFREDKQMDDEFKAWEFWHSRQHSHKQRVIDIDTKNSVGVSPSSIEELAYNAVAVKWNPRDSPIKVNIAIHCLSTDFSNQKGVKGLPLHIQIDTFENVKDPQPLSRAYCQIKVFCDKGAERKARDEERRKQCREKHHATSAAKGNRKRPEEVFHEPVERSEFYPMADLQTIPVLFSPKIDGEINGSRRESPVNLSTNEDDCSGHESYTSLRLTGDSYDSPEEGFYPATKRPRTDAFAPYNPLSNILLYVREKHENVFTAIMLRSPTLQGLLEAVEEKYHVAVPKIKNTFKRSKKGILVRMDDNIIRHYSHESTFIIDLKCTNEHQDYDLILTEIDPS